MKTVEAKAETPMVMFAVERAWVLYGAARDAGKIRLSHEIADAIHVALHGPYDSVPAELVGGEDDEPDEWMPLPT